MFGPAPVGRDRAIGLSERLAAVSSLQSSLEYLTQRKDIEKGGMNDWEVARQNLAAAGPLTRRLVDGVSGVRTTTALHVARSAVALGMLLPGDSRWRGAGNLFLGASSALLSPRHHYGGDGSDQVATLVQLATGAARVVPSPAAKDALLWYAALQANMAYAVSGWVKLFGKPWRDATALGGVMRTRTYGHEGMHRWTVEHPRTAKVLTHSVLALECLFPLVYARGGKLTRSMITSAAAFHVANGYFMGLSRFVPAFPAFHPLVAYTTTPRSHPVGAARDDRARTVAAVALAGGAATAAVTAVRQRMRTTEGWHTSRTLTTRHGNLLQYEEYSPGAPDRPVVVLASGLLSTSEHYAWIAERLAHETRYGVVAYARAGYAGSRRRATTGFQLSESVQDLVDLVNGAVAPHRKVILVGHSIGGELARRAARQLGDRLQGIVYLDSSHPGQFTSGLGTIERGLAGNFASVSRALRLGSGLLLTRPIWISELPYAYRKKVFAQYADARMWEAARREWKAIRADFGSFTGALARIEGVPALVVSAQRTVDRNPEQLLLHRELAEAHVGAPTETVVVEGATHESMLISSRHAHQVTDRIVAFFAGVERHSPTGSAAPAAPSGPGGRPSRPVTRKETAR
ncbi:alpha/beta fold hydrolase [Streptomyces sp. SP18BB07]|uniref:alpha/beta fold hydrolase n=1 Tax=Streptomyces sp. SP18BB07 TaxID=3002522 RepID=UPI002E79A511|nr:alpha/beta fold hydrolase [Streptomyces sp. SP18BB07]MEE1761040.1 alpha/beta fold hydrolase [Streptomyces sp. SP18BB07]